MEFPPQWLKRKAEPVEEFVPATRPDAIGLDIIGGQPKDVEATVEAYVTNLSEFAAQNNIYTSKEKQALYEAKSKVGGLARSAITATNPYEKEKFESRLKSVIEEINGSLTEKLVESIGKNDDEIRQASERTHAETNGTLKEAVGNLGLYETKFDKQREAKAQAFAEKYGIADAREQLLIAEGEYALAIEEQYRSNISLKAFGKEVNLGKKVSKDIQDRYDASRIAWRNALGNAAENAEPQEKILAKFIGVRDTALRATDIANAARERAMGEKEKGLLGKTLGYAKSGAGAVLKAYNKPFELLGESIAEIQNHFTKNEQFDREQAAKNYARASRIVGSALLGTIASAGVAGIASAPLLFRIARGTFGLTAGSTAGKMSGDFYKKIFVTKNKEALMTTLRDLGAIGATDAASLNAEQLKLRKGTRKASEETQKNIEVLAAFLVGGAASIGAGASIHSLGFDKVPSVQSAGGVMENAHAKLVAPPVESAPSSPVHHDIPTPKPESVPAAPASATIENHIPKVHSHEHVVKHVPLHEPVAIRPMTADEAGVPDEPTGSSAPAPEHVTIHPLTAEEAGVSEQEFSGSHTEPVSPVQPTESVAPAHTVEVPQSPASIEPVSPAESSPAPIEAAPTHVEAGTPETSPSVEPAEVSSPSVETHTATVEPLPASAPESAPLPTDHGTGQIQEVQRLHASAEVPPEVPSAQTVETPAAMIPDHTDTAAPISASAPVETSGAVHGVPSSSSPAEAASTVPHSNIASIERLSSSPVWSQYHDHKAYELFDSPAPAETPEAGFRQNLFDLMKTSGTGPNGRETIEEYMARAQSVIDRGGVEIPVIVETPEHLFISHGGDENARIILAREFLRVNIEENPQLAVVVEHAQGDASQGFVMNGTIFTEDQARLAPFEEFKLGKLPKVTKEMTVVL
jgi:hypothetical protein